MDKTDDCVELERKLLSAYIADSKINSNAHNVTTFYELGKLCSTKYMEKPLAMFSDPDMKDIPKKVFGEQCRKVGETWYEDNKDVFMDALMNKKDIPKDGLADLIANITNTYFNSLTEFSMGFYENAGKKAYELTSEMFSNSVEMFNGFWNMCGFKLPEKNGYADKFINLIENHDLAGMIEIYREHPAEINKEYKGAKKFMAFVESRIKK